MCRCPAGSAASGQVAVSIPIIHYGSLRTLSTRQEERTDEERAAVMAN